MKIVYCAERPIVLTPQFPLERRIRLVHIAGQISAGIRTEQKTAGQSGNPKTHAKVLSSASGGTSNIVGPQGGGEGHPYNTAHAESRHARRGNSVSRASGASRIAPRPDQPVSHRTRPFFCRQTGDSRSHDG